MGWAASLFAEKYGHPTLIEAVRRGEGLDDNGDGTGGVADRDDYAACRIHREQDLHDLFVKRFYVGCEADDSINAWAFNRRAVEMRMPYWLEQAESETKGMAADGCSIGGSRTARP